MKKLFLKAGILMLVFMMVLAGMTPAFAAEKTGIYEGQPAKFSYGSPLRTADGQTYQFTGKDLNWMQMYCCNYQTGQTYIGGARELAGPLERYRIRAGGESFVGYCIEHGVMVDETLQLAASDYKNAVISSILGEDVMQNIKLCLFYGRQNGDDINNLLDDQQSGGLGFRNSEFYGINGTSYTLDDWEMATVMLIRESQQKFRDSRFRLKSGGNGLSYTNGWRGPGTGKINKDHYVNPLKGKPAYDIYKYMEQLCCDHLVFSSAIAGMDVGTPKNIVFGAEDRDASGNYHKKIAVSSTKAYPLRAVNKDKPEEDAEGIEIVLTEENGKHYYLLTVSQDIFSEGAVFGLVKALQCRVPANDLMVWECETSNGHLQAITTGMADPVQGYFSLSTKADPVQGEPPEPDYFPVFEFPVSKKDLNPGWDGNTDTPMGDAGLDAVYILYRDGTEVDRVVLDEYGGTEVLTDRPWSDVSELIRTESGQTEQHFVESGGEPPEVTEHGCGTVEPLKVEWSGNCTYTVREAAPEGRFTEPDAWDGERMYEVSYYASSDDERLYACETPQWKDIEYTVSYSNVKGTGSGGSNGPETAGNLDEIISFGEEIFVNDCYRGKITLSKSLEREDVFKDSGLGGHPDSVCSQWKLYLASGGYEGNPYIRFVREEDLADGTAVYRAVRDMSGASNADTDLIIGNNGDMVIYDIPFGTYWMEETSADDKSFVREKFKVEIYQHEGSYTPDDDYDNRYDYNVRNKKITNRIRIIKTDAETGKGVDLAGTRFYIQYKGNPLYTDEQNRKLDNYDRYLPDADDITSDGPYTFEADENGELTILYDLPYGIYEITEWQVPDGYYIEDGGNKYTFVVSSQPMHVDGNFGQLVTYDGRICAADTLYDSAMYPYTAYYQAVQMSNQQVKGRIILDKAGEILTDFKEQEVAGKKVLRPVFEMAGKLKDAVFGIFAAEDIMLSDGNDGPAVYDAATGEKLIVPVSEHFEAGKLYEGGKLEHSSGALLSYRREKESDHGGPGGEDNHYTRTYTSPEQKDTTYTYNYETSDETYNYRYDVQVTMNYQAGGRNVTGVDIAKTTSVINGTSAEIPLTFPEGTVEEDGIPINISPLVSYISGNVAPDEDRLTNSLSVFKTEEISAVPDGSKEAVQKYEIIYTQEAGNSDGFSVRWDDFSIYAKADMLTETAVTTIDGQGALPVIDCGAGFTYESISGITTFTAAEPNPPVYFVSADGIRTGITFFGGSLKAVLEIPQSAVDKDFQNLMPDMGFDWYSGLTPSQPEAEFEPQRGAKVTVQRHENSETGLAESYTVKIISRQTGENPFTVSFADGYTMSFFTETAASGNGTGVLVIDGLYKTTRYVMSELVETMRTDETGKTSSSLLPLGRYYVREVEAPEGYLPDNREFNADLLYHDQMTPVVFSAMRAENYCVPASIQLKKVFETDFGSGIFQGGEEAVFGIYTAEPITAEGGKIIGEDSLVHMFSCGKEPLTTETVKLPVGYRYYLKEIFAPGSYELNHTPFYFELKDRETVTGYYVSYSHRWEEPEIFHEPVEETVLFKGAGTVPFTVSASVKHVPEGEENTGHYAVLTGGADVYNLEQGENITWYESDGTKITAELDADGRMSFSAGGSISGIITSENEPEVIVNGTEEEGLIIYKSVTFARENSFDSAIQVKINTPDNINAGEILNYRKEIPEYTPVPVIPQPELPQPEVPQPEEPQPENPRPEMPEQEEPHKPVKIPETGERTSVYFWLLTAAAALSALFFMRKKEKEN